MAEHRVVRPESSNDSDPAWRVFDFKQFVRSVSGLYRETPAFPCWVGAGSSDLHCCGVLFFQFRASTQGTGTGNTAAPTHDNPDAETS